jgi:hypothetical protein
MSIELIEDAGLTQDASDKDILAVEGVGPATLRDFRAQAKPERKVVATRALLIKEDGKKTSVVPGDELPDWNIVDELVRKGQAKVV